jgi:trimethylamine:corrinoid methyltransferase-like protein
MRTDLWGEYAVLNAGEMERIHRESVRIVEEMGIRVPDRRLQRAAAYHE